jgi:Bacterial SH3 domain
MKNQFIWRSNWIPAALLILAVVGCAGPPNETTQPPVPSPTPAASSPSPVSGEASPTAEPVSNPNVLYQDNFTNPTTNWPQDEFDNYFIGYHEPEWYHIEITSPHQKVTVFAPDKKSYSDTTIELQVFTNSKKTAATGDFRYGLAFRRAGDQYYAFTVSPRSKKWYVLKSSPSGLETLQEGTDDSIHEQDVDDTLRVDAQGANFFFHINDHLVGQVTDPDYAGGEIGLYAESFDATDIHIHYDTLTIRDVQLSLICNINAEKLYVRSGPGKTYPPIALLTTGNTVEPLGVSPDRQWIKIKVKGNEDLGWIFTSEAFVTCNASIDLLPTVSQ